VSFYSRIPGAQAVVASMSGTTPPTSRGFRMNNYDRIEAVFGQALDDAFADKVTPMAALESAAFQARSLAGGETAPAHPEPHRAPAKKPVAKKPVEKK
jgi:multiple sugar transport system substrate-binding protein